jgi:mannosyltransferase OCH1-like enzyme
MMSNTTHSVVNGIPKIIHQIWGGERELPEYFKSFSNTWKENHPEWQYHFWNDNSISEFVEVHYPQYSEMFHRFTYNVQRWDTARYMIIGVYGGIYADFDSECLKPLDDLIANKSCIFSLEPDYYAKNKRRVIQPATSIFGSAPGHPFIKEVIKTAFSGLKKTEYSTYRNKLYEVINSTGPIMVADAYEGFKDKESIHLIPHKYFSSFENTETAIMLNGDATDELKTRLEERIKDAYTVHYYFMDWRNDDN